jgi:solute:Na+ symporter, SSS family
MNAYISAIPLILYMIGVAYVLYGVKKRGENATAASFQMGTRNYGLIAVSLSIATTMIGPGYSMGVVEKAQAHGFFFLLFYLGAMVSLVIFGVFFVPQLPRDVQIRTVGDFLGRHYDKAGQIISGCLVLLQSVVLTAIMASAGGQVLSLLFGFSPLIGALLVVVGTSLYSLFGGMPAVVRTDGVQMFFMVAVLVIAWLCATHLSPNQITSATVSELNLWDSNGMTPSQWFGLFVAFFLGEAFIPAYTTRAFIAKSTKVASNAFVVAAIFGALWFLALTWIGVQAQHLPDIAKQSGVSPMLGVINFTLGADPNVWSQLLLGVAAVGFLSIIMSTLDTIISTGSTSFIRDVVMILSKKQGDQKLELSLNQFVLLVITLAGTAVTVFELDIVSLLVGAYTIWVPTILFPIAYCTLRPASIRNRRSALWAMIAGATAWGVANAIWPDGPSILWGLALNVLVFSLANRVQSSPRQTAA